MKNIIFKNFPIWSLVLIFILLSSKSYSKDVVEFEKIMQLMDGAKITYERIGKYKRPMKVYKKKNSWTIKQTIKGFTSKIKSAGDSKISFNDFPSGWTINGTWEFSRNENNCKIDHVKGGMVMRWKCE